MSQQAKGASRALGVWRQTAIACLLLVAPAARAASTRAASTAPRVQVPPSAANGTRACLVITGWPKGITPGVAEFTVFGEAVTPR